MSFRLAGWSALYRCDVAALGRRTRVYDLARLFDVDARSILGWLREHDRPARSASSVLSNDAAAAVKEAFVEIAERAIRERPAGRAHRQRYRMTPVGRYIAEHHDMLGDDAAAAWADAWLRNFFDTEEALEWLRAGAPPNMAPQAAALRAEGFTAELACQRVPCGTGGSLPSAFLRMVRDEVDAREVRRAMEAAGVAFPPRHSLAC